MVASTLGKDINTGNLVTLEQEARLRGLYVIGKTGSGKTTLLINLILQDIEEGMGVCFFDTHGDPINAILARLPATRIVEGVERATEDDVILLDPLDKDATFGLNLFQCDPTDEEQVSRTVSYVLEAFAKLFTKEGDFSTEAPNMELTLRNAAYTLIDNLSIYGTTMAELPLLIDDEEARTNLIRNIAGIHSEPMRFWNRYNRIKQDERDRITSSAYSRVNRFLTNVFIKEVVGQSFSTLNFRKIMDERKIVLVKLSRRDRELTNLVGSIIIGQIANAAFSREDTPEKQRVQFNLYADEYQRFATPTFAELLAEVRKYKIATCVAHQWRQQLDVDNRKATLNAGTMVVFEVTGEDAEELAKQFKAEPQLQPGELRHEPILDPVEEEYTYVEWKPPEAKEEYIKAITKKREITGQYGVLKACLASGEMVYILPDKYKKKEHERDFSIQFNPMSMFMRPPNDLQSTLREIAAPRNVVPPPLPNERFFTVLQGADPERLITPAEDRLIKYEQMCHDHSEHDIDWYNSSLTQKEIDERERNEITNKDMFYEPGFPYGYVSGNRFLWKTYVVPEGLPYLRSLLPKIQEQLKPYKDNPLFRFVPTNQNVQDIIEPGNIFYIYVNTHLDVNCGFWRIQPFHFLINFLRDDAERIYRMSQTESAPLDKRIAELLMHRVDVTKTRFTGEFQNKYIREMRPGGRSSREERSPLYTYTISEGRPETYDNAQARVANELDNPKKKFTAQVKLESGEEHTIEIEETERFRPANAGSDILSRQLIIVDQTRLNYCKRRVNIEQEIAARQEELTRRVKPIAKARTGDDTQTPLSPVQLQKLQKIRVALGDKDYDLFFNDREVKQRRGELLDSPKCTTDEIRNALNDWRQAGSPSDVSPFEELIKTLLS